MAVTDRLYIDTASIHIVMQDLPPRVRSFVVKDCPDGYCIIVNSRLSLDQQRKAVHHEITHIRCGQVDNDIYNEYI